MKLDFTQKGKVIIDMVDYFKSMVKFFLQKDLQGTTDYELVKNYSSVSN